MLCVLNAIALFHDVVTSRILIQYLLVSGDRFIILPRAIIGVADVVLGACSPFGAGIALDDGGKLLDRLIVISGIQIDVGNMVLSLLTNAAVGVDALKAPH